jgi:hypothetical protein
MQPLTIGVNYKGAGKVVPTGRQNEGLKTRHNLQGIGYIISRIFGQLLQKVKKQKFCGHKYVRTAFQNAKFHDIPKYY